MQARDREKEDSSSPKRWQLRFRSEIEALVGKAEKDPYVRNRIEALRRSSPDLLSKVPAVSFSGREKNPLFHNRGDGTFSEIGSVIGLGRQEDGRGMIVADFDGDGDGDVLLHNYYRNPLVALRNDMYENPPMVVIRLKGVKSNRFGIGSRVEVEEGGQLQVQELSAGSGFLSGNPSELYFAVQKSATVRVRWPLGLVQEWKGVPSRFGITFTEGDKEFKKVVLLEGVRSPEARVSARKSLLSGDSWPKAEGKGTKIVVLYRLSCFACREELDEWKRWESRIKEIRGVRLLWRSLGGDPEDLFLQLRREGIRIEVETVSSEKIFPEGDSVVPAVFVLDPEDRVRARFIGPGSVEKAIQFLQKTP